MSEEANSEGPPAAVVRRVTGAFLVFADDDLVRPLEPYGEGETPLAGLIRDAVEGLKAALHAATIPFTLTYHRVQDLRFDRLHNAERIRALKDTLPGGELTEALESQAFEAANKRMREFLASKEGTEYIRDGVVYELDAALHSAPIQAASVQLLVQALVATWSIFEVFISSFIVNSINAEATIATRLLTNPDTKRHLGKPVVDIDAIDAHGFDLTSSMGTVLFAERRLDRLALVRDILDVILPDEGVRAALRSESLWMLNQRRHLFVHRRGVVDREYLARTGDTTSLGSRLPVTSHDVEGYLLTVRDAILAVASAASARGA